MIWHIFKKDVRLLWRYALGLAVVRCFETILRFWMDGGASGLDQTFRLLLMVDVCAALGLITLLVHQDAIPGVRHDWLVRPVRRRDLLGAKVLFVVLLMSGPAFLTNWLAALAHGFSWQSSLGSSLAFSIPLLTGYYLPALAFASLTRNLTETISGVVIAWLVLAALEPFVNWGTEINVMQFGSGTSWLVDWAELLLLLCGAAAVLSIQYFRRKTLWARWLTVWVALLSLAVFNVPWQPLFAVQQSLSPAPGSASTIRLTFDPSQGRSDQPMGNGRDGRAEVSLPIRISGIPPDSVLKIDWATFDGKTVNLGKYSHVFNPPPTTADGLARTSIHVANDLFTQFQDRPMPLEIDYSLTLLRLVESHAMPARGGKVVPAAGDCWNALGLAGTAVRVGCVAPDSAPSCMVLFLENPNTGARNYPVTRCFPNYAPVYSQMEPDALYRTWADLPIRDAAGLAPRYPVDGSQLWNSRVVMRIYKVAEHFTRHLEIPDVRMSDWVPQ